MPRHAHTPSKHKPTKAIIQGIQEAREAKLEAQRELIEQNERLRLHTQQAHLKEETLSQDDNAPNLAALDKDRTIKFNREEDENHDKKPEENKRPVKDPEVEQEKEIEEPEQEKPIHTSFKGIAPFLPLWEDSMKEMFAMQLQMTQMVTESWLKLCMGQWYPPSPMND